MIVDNRPSICKFFRPGPPGPGSCIHPDRALLYPAENCRACHVPGRHTNRIEPERNKTRRKAKTHATMDL